MTQAQPLGANPLAGVARAWPRIPASDNMIHDAATPGRVARLWQGIVDVLTAKHARARAEGAYYPPRRESFVEEAAMAREMWRL